MPLFKRHHFDKILDLASKGRIAPLYLFVGRVEVGQDLARRLFRFLVEKGLFPEEIDLKEQGLEALLASLVSPVLLGRKVIHLKAEEPLPLSKAEEVVQLLEGRKQSFSLILALGDVSEKDPLFKFAKEAGVLMALPQRKGADLLRYEIPELLSEFNKKMDRDTAELLVSLVGEDLSALRQEIEKLALFVGERSVIHSEDVMEVVSPRLEAAPYSVLEALFSKGPDEALRLTQELLTQGVYPLVLVSTFLTFFKRLWALKELLEKNPDLGGLDYPRFRQRFEQVKKEFWGERPPKVVAKVHPYALFRMLRVAEKFPGPAFSQVFAQLKGLDESLKLGSLPLEAFYAFFWGLKGLARRKGAPARRGAFVSTLRGL